MNSSHKSNDKLHHVTCAKAHSTHVLLLSQSWTTGHVHRTEPDSLPRERKRVYPMVYCTRSLGIHWLHAEHALILRRLRGKSSTQGRGRLTRFAEKSAAVLRLWSFLFCLPGFHLPCSRWNMGKDVH